MSPRLAFWTLVAALLWAALPAQAKVPPFSVEVEPATPVAGQATTVTLELTQPIHAEELPGLIAFFRAEDADRRVNGIPITLEQVGETTYRAQVILPDAGDWRIVSFPDRTGWPTDEVPENYPDQIPVEVVDSRSSTLAAALLVAGLIGGAALLARRNRTIQAA